MARLFTFYIYYQGYYLWVKVVEHHHSPPSFDISIQDHKDIDLPENIILNTVNDKLVLAEQSPLINDEILKLLTEKIKEHSIASHSSANSATTQS